MLLTHTNRPTKRAAYELVLELRSDKRELSASEIDSLINYFAPTRPKIAKTPEQWVAKAASAGKEPRQFLRFVHVKDGMAVASDGHRAHRARTALADGVYCPQTLLPTEVCKNSFELLSRVFGRVSEPMASVMLEDLPTKAPKARLQTTRFLGSLFNRRYLLEALNGSEEVNGAVSDASKEGTLHGSAEFGTYVIGGMRP